MWETDLVYQDYVISAEQRGIPYTGRTNYHIVERHEHKLNTNEESMQASASAHSRYQLNSNERLPRGWKLRKKLSQHPFDTRRYGMTVLHIAWCCDASSHFVTACCLSISRGIAVQHDNTLLDVRRQGTMELTSGLVLPMCMPSIVVSIHTVFKHSPQQAIRVSHFQFLMWGGALPASRGSRWMSGRRGRV